ncbi:MAG TPA: NAD(P)-dependent oxidoreductase [Porticoccaceae bacterium]|nr:NAD(P)-dependent oxidoreductase [Porticoccaceae bacterium]
MITRVAFIGLGVMGFPMAGHLQRAGLQVAVFNRTAARARDWEREFGGRVAASPAAAAAGAELVLSCVGRDADVREIALGPDGALAAMVPGALLVDHTTASAELARELDARCRERGLGFLDAPVSGGEQGARNGRLTVMCGGDAEVFARAEPVLAHYARAVRLLGPAGSGQLCKMVNQICIAGVVQGLAEGIHFALRAGLDAEAVIEVISQGAAQSWQMENRHATMIRGEYHHGFAVDWMRKDLEILLSEARHNGARLPLAALVDQFYADIQAAGGGRWDTSSLLARLEGRGDNAEKP